MKTKQPKNDAPRADTFIRRAIKVIAWLYFVCRKCVQLYLLLYFWNIFLLMECVRFFIWNKHILSAAATVFAALLNNKSHRDAVTVQGKLPSRTHKQVRAPAHTHKQKNNVVIMSLTNILIYTFYMEQNMRPAASGFDKCSRFNEHRRHKYCTPGGKAGGMLDREANKTD